MNGKCSLTNCDLGNRDRSGEGGIILARSLFVPSRRSARGYDVAKALNYSALLL